MELNHYQERAMTTCMPSCEIWKPTIVEGYEVSNNGRVRSTPRQIVRKNGIIQTFRGRILCQNNALRYATVALSKKGKVKTYYIHRLVAMAFVQNPNGYKEVNHLDENCMNNHSDNLEWCSHVENLNYGTHNKKISKALSKIICAKKEGEILIFPSLTKAAEKLGVTIQSVSQSIKKNHKVKGYNLYYGTK